MQPRPRAISEHGGVQQSSLSKNEETDKISNPVGGVSQFALDLEDAVVAAAGENLEGDEEDNEGVGGAVEMLQIEDVMASHEDNDDNSASYTPTRADMKSKRPLKRTVFKSRKMLGNSAYWGRDRIKPVDKCFVIITVFLVLVPSMPALAFTPFYLFDWLGGAAISLAYFCSLVNVLRVLYLCATLDPGIIPKIRAKSINYQKTYKVAYREENDLESLNAMARVEAHFDQRRFKAVRQVAAREVEENESDVVAVACRKMEENERQEPLSYCSTCQIVRPPRSYHCSDCGFCCEVHDHHCPWMGTCIGRRNIRYFICFLFYASLHGFVTAVIGALNFFLVTVPNFEQVFGRREENLDEGEEVLSQPLRVFQFINFVTVMYGVSFFSMLGAFAHSNHSQAMDNLTTNEKLRNKWNAKHRKLLQENGQNPPHSQNATFCERFKFFYFGELPESRIQKYHELRELAIQKARAAMQSKT